MSYPQYQYTPEPMYSEEYISEMKRTKERLELRMTANSVGLAVLVSSIIFLLASFIISLIYNVFAFDKVLPSSIDSIPDNILTGLANVAVIGVSGLIFIKASKGDLRESLVFDRISAAKLIGLVVIGFTVCMLSNLFTNIYLENVYTFGIYLYFDIETPVSNSAAEILIYFISTAVVPAFSEEILFRGAIMSKLRRFGDSTAVFVSALLFGLYHGNFIQIPFAFVVGLVLAWTVVYTNSMLPAILIHMANNGFSVISDIFYTNAESLGINEAVIDIASYAIMFIAVIASFVAINALSKRDRNLLRLKKYDGPLDRRTKTNQLSASPTIIIASIFLIIEAIANHAAIAVVS